MKQFTEDEIELLLQGLGILRDVYEEIVDENLPAADCEPCAAHRLAALRLVRTRELIVKCRELKPHAIKPQAIKSKSR